MRLLVLLLCLIGCVCGTGLKAQSPEIWYNEATQRWEECGPLCNGRIGMMPNGNVHDESIVLNEISMWAESSKDQENYELCKSVAGVRQLLFADENNDAERLFNENLVCRDAGSGHGNGEKVPHGCFQNLGYLNFLHSIAGDISGYKRTLDISRAVATTSFKAGDTHYLREYFTSFASNIGVIRLTASKKKAISFATHFYRDEHVQDIKVTESELKWRGALPNGKGRQGLQFAGQVTIEAKGGTRMVYDNQIIIKNADEVVIYFTASTDYYAHDPVLANRAVLKGAAHWRFKRLLAKHQKAYRNTR